MRAAGRTLTVGELWEALDGCLRNDPVVVVTSDGAELHVEAVDGLRRDVRLAVRALPRETDLDEDALTFVLQVATGELDAVESCNAAVRLARRLGLVE